MILADQYNHSSLKSGAILSGATVIEYSHCDLVSLQTHLQQRDRYRRCLIVTDSVFSMDGDLCRLPELLDLAEQHNCMLLIDEAHATGVLGNGAGCVEHFSCTQRQLIQVGTLSKALGSLGGYVAGSKILIDFLRNRAPSWIYTTALSPANAAAALTAIRIVQQEPERRQQLWRNIDNLKLLLHQQLPHLQLLPSESAILCLLLPSPASALTAANSLQDAGVFAPAIRPPTVPTSRIRISLMATHTFAHIQQLVDSLSAIEIVSPKSARGDRQ